MTAFDGDAGARNVTDLDRVVLAGPDGISKVESHLLAVDVEGGHELDVPYVVATEVDVHQAGHELARIGVAVVVDALHQRCCAVTDAHNGDSD